MSETGGMTEHKPFRRPELSDAQRVFYTKVCERLGIDPATVSASDFAFEVVGGQDLGRVRLTAYLPADELVQMIAESGLTP